MIHCFFEVPCQHQDVQKKNDFGDLWPRDAAKWEQSYRALETLLSLTIFIDDGPVKASIKSIKALRDKTLHSLREKAQKKIQLWRKNGS